MQGLTPPGLASSGDTGERIGRGVSETSVWVQTSESDPECQWPQREHGFHLRAGQNAGWECQEPRVSNDFSTGLNLKARK